MSIPMVDLNAEYALLEPELLPAVKTALASGQYVQGPNVRAFEQEVARYLGVRHAIGVASGTDALMLALRAAGVGPGDEVITTPFSFIATASAIAMTGARPVFVDIDPLTFNLDPANVEAAITPRTRAVLPVHLYGQAVDLEPLLAICACHGLRLIEDCAQAMGADYKGRKVGAWGRAGCLSFDPSQTLGAFGDGGMVVTDDDALAARVRMLANHGSVIRDQHEVLGCNSRLDELQAAVLRVKLLHLDEFNRRRRENARRYREALAGLAVQLPVETGLGTHVYHHFTIASDERERIRAALARQGIASAVHYPLPLHRQPLWHDAYADVRLPHAERAAQRVLSLPMSPLLKPEQIDAVADAIAAALGVRRRTGTPSMS
ncbi:MAG: DegT/DnrJ/EryC1/StrS family aminotransferase [Burkholderiaceae bacterium]|nr:DegT/DnrJ/EryC1/StrS family aminotransferase [Burkholderiaceae bacterium]